MRRRKFLCSLMLAPALAMTSRTLSVEDPPPHPPNIILILVDDLGWTDLSCMGSRYYKTPNIDRLATEGILFTSAYANAPNCAPSRACLMTGLYSPRHGIYTVGSSERGRARDRKLIPIPNRQVLDGEAVTIAELLHEAGYATASIGKWHLGKGDQTGPRGQGFDINIGGNRAGSPRSYFSPYRNPDIVDGPAGEYLTDRLTDEAISFIESHRDTPFFVYLPHYAVHAPLQAKKNKIEKYEQKPAVDGHANPRYAAMIESVDENLGRILDKLDELELAQNTLVLFFSDNGGFAGATSNKPLRGFKGMLYEGGIRVPFIARWPGRIEPARKCDVPVIGIDLFPTLLEIAGAAPPDGAILDGESLMPLMTGRCDTTRQAIFWHFPVYVESGKALEGTWRTTPAGAIRAGAWKLIEFFEDGRLELYNLDDDIGEANNLAAAMPEKAAELHETLRRWREAVGAPVPREMNPRYHPDGNDVDDKPGEKKDEEPK
jgi:arylsulfatase A-like enzyme